MTKVTSYNQLDEENKAGQCFVLWKPGIPCLNAYTHVVEAQPRAGYMKVCNVHKEGWERQYGATKNYRLWTREEWEKSGREAELDEKIKASHN